MQGVLRAMYREIRGLHQAAYVLAVFTFGSQLLALVRDRLLAHSFGAGIELDLYYTAFRIPDFLYVLFASTLSVYVLIPFVAVRISGTDSEKARALLSQIFTLFLVGYSVLALLIIIMIPVLVPYLFPGFIEHAETLTTLIRILLLQPLLLGVSSLVGVITQFAHRFVLYAVSPLIYNFGIILGVLFLYPLWGMEGLAWGVVFGALGHLLIQVPFVSGSELAPRITTKIVYRDIRDVLKTSLPRVLTLSLHQCVLLVLIGVASSMSIGSVSVFQFAFNLQSVPLAIIGVSYSVAAFPVLAQFYAEQQFKRFSDHIETAFRHIIFWSLPVIALLIVERAQFVRVILGSGEFDWGDTRLTAAILAIFAVSLASQAVHLLIVRALYAAGNTRLPFIITLFSSLGALLTSYGVYLAMLRTPSMITFFEEVMRLQGVVGIEVLALPIGYAAALLLESVILVLLSRRQLRMSVRSLVLPVVRAGVAAVVTGAVAYITLNFFATTVETDTLLSVFLQGAYAGIMGLTGGLIAYYLLRTPELTEIYTSLHKRIMKTHVVIPQDEDQLAL